VKRSLKRLLIAGGAGFIGSNFVRLLRKRRPSVGIVVLDSLTYAGNRANISEFQGAKGFEFVHDEITNRKKVDELAADVDAIINFAAHTHVDRSLLDPREFVEVNIHGTAILCQAAVKHEHEVFLQVSTDEVYGEVLKGRSVESHPLKPRSPYAASKAGGEHIAWAYSQSFGLPLIVTRGSNSYGPRQYPEKLVAVLITNAIDDRPLPLYNDGSAVRDFLYVEDHCRAIDLVLHSAPANTVYNVGTGMETSGKQVAEEILTLMHKPKTLIQYVQDRPGHDYRYALNVSKISQLGWEPQVALREGLRRTIRWYTDNQEWWRPLRSAKYWKYYRRNYRPLVS
jgi:dTDP-glucose 4,6-dehydratase